MLPTIAEGIAISGIENPQGIDLDQEFTFEIEIFGVGNYIGKYKNINSLIAAYRSNINGIINGKPPRSGKTGYRSIYFDLISAKLANKQIVLRILGGPRTRANFGQGSLNGQPVREVV